MCLDVVRVGKTLVGWEIPGNQCDSVFIMFSWQTQKHWHTGEKQKIDMTGRPSLCHELELIRNRFSTRLVHLLVE